MGVDSASRWSLIVESEKERKKEREKERKGSTERGGQCSVAWYLGFLR